MREEVLVMASQQPDQPAKSANSIHEAQQHHICRKPVGMTVQTIGPADTRIKHPHPAYLQFVLAGPSWLGRGRGRCTDDVGHFSEVQWDREKAVVRDTVSLLLQTHQM
jgi:hypothetical protein